MLSFSYEHYDRLQEMVLKGSSSHFERGDVFKMKAGEPKNKIYYKTHVLLGVQQKLFSESAPGLYKLCDDQNVQFKSC